MALDKQRPRLPIGVVLTAITLAAGSVVRGHSATFTPFQPQALPQSALGDFDGDGQIDTVLIQHTSGDRRISVQLSGSASAVHLDDSVTGVIEDDIDHDGDLDLVAATPSGDVLIWLNDGHGRFTRQPPSRTHGLAGGPVIGQAAWTNAGARGIRAPFVPSPARAETIVGVRNIRPRTTSLPLHARSALLPTLRG